MNSPVRRIVANHGPPAIAQVDNTVRMMIMIVAEILFDHLSLVAASDDELAEPRRGVHRHDVPKDRAATDLDQRLRSNRRLLGQPRPQAAGENDGPHGPTSAVAAPALPAGSP